VQAVEPVPVQPLAVEAVQVDQQMVMVAAWLAEPEDRLSVVQVEVEVEHW
jgi:hypothetical protein